MWNFIRTLLFVYMESICCDMFVGIFFSRRRKWGTLYSAAVWTAYCSLKTVYICMLSDYLIFKIVLGLAAYTVFMSIRYRGKVWKVFLCVGGYMGLLMTCDLVFMMIWENIFVWRWQGAYYKEVYITLITVITKMLEFLLFVCFHRIFAKNSAFYKLDNRGWGRFLIFSLFTITALIILWWDEGYRDSTVLIISFGLMLLNVMFYFTMWDIVNKEREKQEYRLMQEKAKGQLKLFGSMEAMYGEQRKRIHEFKNHIGCIQGLLETGQIDKAQNYVNGIQQDIFQSDSTVKTGNNIIDVIVNQKYREAVKEHITFVMALDRLENFPLEDDDTVILLSNLLDNAVEACKKIESAEEKIIKLKLVQKGSRYILVVSNRVRDEVTIQRQVAETTKKNKYEHGIGMQNIKEIIQKYDAEGECKCENGWFIYTIILNVERKNNC